MKSLANLGNHPSGITLVADDVLEFHAARLLLLLKICGERGWIHGLTKFAKLDFFVRYPDFFMAVLGTPLPRKPHSVESLMVRHHYGPWDPRYYHLLAYLASRDLVATAKERNRFDIGLTEAGAVLAARIAHSGDFSELVTHMEAVGKQFGALTGSKLKTLVYETFDREVAQLPRGEAIE